MVRQLGPDRARRLAARLQELEATESLAEMRHLPAARCHELKGDRQGQLALSISGGDRLIIEPAHDPPPQKADGGLDWERVTEVTVVEIGDYH